MPSEMQKVRFLVVSPEELPHLRLTAEDVGQWPSLTLPKPITAPHELLAILTEAHRQSDPRQEQNELGLDLQWEPAGMPLSYCDLRQTTSKKGPGSTTYWMVMNNLPEGTSRDDLLLDLVADAHAGRALKSSSQLKSGSTSVVIMKPSCTYCASPVTYTRAAQTVVARSHCRNHLQQLPHGTVKKSPKTMNRAEKKRTAQAGLVERVENVRRLRLEQQLAAERHADPDEMAEQEQEPADSPRADQPCSSNEPMREGTPPEVQIRELGVEMPRCSSSPSLLESQSAGGEQMSSQGPHTLASKAASPEQLPGHPPPSPLPQQPRIEPRTTRRHSGLQNMLQRSKQQMEERWADEIRSQRTQRLLGVDLFPELGQDADQERPHGHVASKSHVIAIKRDAVRFSHRPREVKAGQQAKRAKLSTEKPSVLPFPGPPAHPVEVTEVAPQVKEGHQLTYQVLQQPAAEEQQPACQSVVVSVAAPAPAQAQFQAQPSAQQVAQAVALGAGQSVPHSPQHTQQEQPQASSITQAQRPPTQLALGQPLQVGPSLQPEEEAEFQLLPRLVMGQSQPGRGPSDLSDQPLYPHVVVGQSQPQQGATVGAVMSREAQLLAENLLLRAENEAMKRHLMLPGPWAAHTKEKNAEGSQTVQQEDQKTLAGMSSVDKADQPTAAQPMQVDDVASQAAATGRLTTALVHPPAASEALAPPQRHQAAGQAAVACSEWASRVAPNLSGRSEEAIPNPAFNPFRGASTSQLLQLADQSHLWCTTPRQQQQQQQQLQQQTEQQPRQTQQQHQPQQATSQSQQQPVIQHQQPQATSQEQQPPTNEQQHQHQHQHQLLPLAPLLLPSTTETSNQATRSDIPLPWQMNVAKTLAGGDVPPAPQPEYLAALLLQYAATKDAILGEGAVGTSASVLAGWPFKSRPQSDPHAEKGDAGANGPASSAASLVYPFDPDSEERLRRQLSELLDAQQQLATSQHHQQQQQHQQSFAQQRLQQLDTQQHKVENHQQLPQQQQASRSQQQVLMPSVLLPRPLCAPSQPLTQPLQGGAAAGMPRPAATGPKATTGPLRPHLVAKFLKLLKSQMQQESLVSPGLPRAYAQLSGSQDMQWSTSVAEQPEELKRLKQQGLMPGIRSAPPFTGLELGIVAKARRDAAARHSRQNPEHPRLQALRGKGAKNGKETDAIVAASVAAVHDGGTQSESKPAPPTRSTSLPSPAVMNTSNDLMLANVLVGLKASKGPAPKGPVPKGPDTALVPLLLSAAPPTPILPLFHLPPAPSLSQSSALDARTQAAQPPLLGGPGQQAGGALAEWKPPSDADLSSVGRAAAAQRWQPAAVADGLGEPRAAATDVTTAAAAAAATVGRPARVGMLSRPKGDAVATEALAATTNDPLPPVRVWCMLASQEHKELLMQHTPSQRTAWLRMTLSGAQCATQGDLLATLREVHNMRSAENPFRFDPVGKLMPSAEYDMRQTLPPQRPKTRYFLLRRASPSQTTSSTNQQHGGTATAGASGEAIPTATTSARSAAVAWLSEACAADTATAATARAGSAGVAAKGSTSSQAAAAAAAAAAAGDPGDCAADGAAGETEPPVSNRGGGGGTPAGGETAEEWVDLDEVTSRLHSQEAQRIPDRQADGSLAVLAVRDSCRFCSAPIGQRADAKRLKVQTLCDYHRRLRERQKDAVFGPALAAEQKVAAAPAELQARLTKIAEQRHSNAQYGV